MVFENSTVCHVDGFLFVFWVNIDSGYEFYFVASFGLPGCLGFHWFSMESLILAQDERWRRA